MGLIRLIGPTRTARGGYGTYENIRGWLWSENIGWVNFNCYNNYDDDANFECCCPGGAGGAYCPSDAETCPYTLAGGNYGVSYNTTNYKVSGYAWASENPGEGLGWVCFGETCCSGTCNGELADKAPDGYDAWACVGKRKSDGSCSGDCGEYFNTADGSGCTGSGENCTVDSDNNFIAHWRFNSLYGTAGNKVEDCQGTNNEGTLSTGFNTSTALVAGKWGNALKFDGSDDYVSVADATGIGLEGSAWTVEAWVKPIQLKNYGNIFEKFPGALTSGWGIITFANGSWNFQRYTDDWSDVPGGPAGTLVNNKWTHIAVTYDGTNVRTYNDGVLYTTQAQGTITDNDLDLHIGADIPNSRYFDGVIDNVAIYSRAKTAEEIWDDAHIEMSGWAKVINLDDKGWLKLKGQDTNGNWFGTYLNNYSQGGGFYSV
ncbi:MAG: LamG domain-containing protein, partial [candidate division WOR-3 bacterium]